MKKKFIIFADETDIICYQVTTEDNYILEVEDLFGKILDFSKFNIIERFDDRYFQIDPYYWFRGYEVK